jgi:hypothetical protein
MALSFPGLDRGSCRHPQVRLNRAVLEPQALIFFDRQGPDAAYGIYAAYADAASKAYENRVKAPAYGLVVRADSVSVILSLC